MPSTLVCPECDAKVRTRQELEPGKKVRCPKCEAVFAVPGEDDDSEGANAAIQDRPVKRGPRASASDDGDEKPLRRRSRVVEDGEEEDRPRKKPKKKKKSGGGVPALVWVLLALLLLGGGGTGLYFALSNKDKEGKPQSKGGDKKDDKNGGGEGQLTADNFKKLRMNMTEAEVTRLIGPPTVPPVIEQKGPFPSRSLTWKIEGAAVTHVNTIFVNDKLANGGGQINGERVSLVIGPGPGGRDPFGGGGKVTRENYSRIEKSMFGGMAMNRSQVEAILGPPTSNLGSQPISGGFRSTESLLWSDGSDSITADFLNGKVSGLRWKSQ